jgi:hypothetical protein
MWEKIVDIGKTAASMLTSGSVPPNTPTKYVEELGSINFLRSKKFFITFTSAIAIFIFFGISVCILFLTAPFPAITAAFTTFYIETLKVVMYVIAFYLGLQTSLDFKYNSNSNIDLKSENVTVVETKRIIREGEGNAPEIKPFGMIAIDE